MSKRSKVFLFVSSLVLIAIGVGNPAEVSAHGPTIKISHEELKPSLLNLFVGSTVHFSNTVAMPGGHVIVIRGDDGEDGDASEAIESPALEKPGDGWHYTFEQEGRFEIHIKQHPTAKARVVVVSKR
jgi:plastocyanin